MTDNVEVTPDDVLCANAMWQLSLNYGSRKEMEECVARHRLAATASNAAMVGELVEALERMQALLPLMRLITVRQAIEAGDRVINACGLNPWCINEGRATGSEPAISSWMLPNISDLIARAKASEVQP
jgi:hypothetical protein